MEKIKVWMKLLVIIIASMFANESFAMYKCVDASGKTSYQSSRCVEIAIQKKAPKAKPKPKKQGGAKGNLIEIGYDDSNLLMVVPPDWLFKEDEGSIPEYKTIRIESPGENGVMMLLSVFKIPDRENFSERQRLNHLRDVIEHQYLKRTNSGMLESRPFRLELMPVMGHIYSFIDRDLESVDELPEGEYRYTFPAAIVTPSFEITATIFSNVAESEDIFIAQLMLGLLNIDAPLKLGAAPNGFDWLELPRLKAALLKPATWHSKIVDKNQSFGAFISKENIDKEGSFLTGLTFNFVNNVRDRLDLSPSEVAYAFAATAAEEGEVLIPPSRNKVGPFNASLVTIKMADNVKGDYVVHQKVIANDITGSLYLIIFEAPEDEWKSAWENFGKQMTEKIFLDTIF